MSFDGLVTGAIARQLNDVLSGGKIEKIYQPEEDELVILIHAGGEKHRLYISANGGHARMNLIKRSVSNPQNPMSFCMLLRKHFQGGRITEIKQVESERIVEIYVAHADEMGFPVSKKLIVEIMGKHSNIIAFDISSGRILDCIKRISLDVNRFRQLLPGMPYVFPPSQDKVPLYSLTEEQLERILRNNPQDIAKALVSGIQGISPSIAEEICSRASIRSAGDSVNKSAALLYPVINELISDMQTGRFAPSVYIDKDKMPVDFHIFTLSTLEGCYDKIVPADISEAAEIFYEGKDSKNRNRQKASDLKKAAEAALDKLYLKKQRLSEDILKAQNSEAYRLYGELLTANLHSAPQSADKISVFNYYDNNMIDIPLDPRFSPAKNAQRYFKKYGKAKTAIKEKSIQLEDTNHSIDYLNSVLTFVEQAGTVEEIEEIRQELVEGGYLRKRKNNYNPSKSKLQPCAFNTSDGFRILVGRNNKENDILTFKTADKKDIWLHTKDIPGSHVILLTGGRQPTETAIFEAAALAAYHSKARNSENVAVDYTQVRYVKKPAGAKPGMVIFTDNHTVYVNPKLW